MSTVLNNSACTTLSRILGCLVKVSDNVFVKVDDGIALFGVNAPQSASAAFLIHRDLCDSVDNRAYQVMVSTKALLAPLRPRFIPSIKQCAITLDVPAGVLDLRILNTDGVSRSIGIHFAMVPFPYTGMPRLPDPACTLVAAPLFLRMWLDQLGVLASGRLQLNDDISFRASPHSFALKCDFAPRESQPAHHMSAFDAEVAANLNRASSTELVLHPSGFISYDLAPSLSPVCISFEVKEFRALVAFAEATGANLRFQFASSGHPLLLSCDLRHVQCAFALATAEVPVQFPATTARENGDGTTRLDSTPLYSVHTAPHSASVHMEPHSASVHTAPLHSASVHTAPHSVHTEPHSASISMHTPPLHSAASFQSAARSPARSPGDDLLVIPPTPPEAYESEPPMDSLAEAPLFLDDTLEPRSPQADAAYPMQSQDFASQMSQLRNLF